MQSSNLITGEERHVHQRLTGWPVSLYPPPQTPGQLEILSQNTRWWSAQWSQAIQPTQVQGTSRKKDQKKWQRPEAVENCCEITSSGHNSRTQNSCLNQTCIHSRQWTFQHREGEAHETWALVGDGSWESWTSLRVQLQVGCPCCSTWPHTVCIWAVLRTQQVIGKRKKGMKLGGVSSGFWEGYVAFIG